MNNNPRSKGKHNNYRQGKPKPKHNVKPNKEQIEDNFNAGGSIKLDKKSLEKASNNPKLYQRFPELLRWASNVPINVISNLPAPLGDNSLTLPNIVLFGISLISPCSPNSSNERNTNMIQLSNDLYARIRQDNAGAKNYDPPALTRLIFAMAGVFQRINYLQRIYGLINHTSVYNRAFPQMLFRAMHLDYESFRDDQANFAGRLDTIIVRAKDIRLVADIPILERIGMMYANYYIDTSDMRDTLYIPCPAVNGFLDMDSTENLIFSSGPQNLPLMNGSYPDSDNKLVTADDLLKDTEQYLNKVLTSQDFGIMQGDIVHAFPGASLTTLNSLPDKLDLPPLDDKAMLLQYHNADVGGTYWKTNNNFFLSFDAKGLPVGNYELPTTTSNPHHMHVDYAYNKPTGSIPANITNNRFYKDYSFMCLDSDTTDPDWFVEVTRMKAEAGVDIITNVVVLKAIDTKVLNDIAATYTYTPTEEDITFTYGPFPYTKYDLDYKSQHVCRLVPITDVANQSQFRSNGIHYATDFDYGGRSTDGNDMVNQCAQVWDRLRAICRYLPYGLTNLRYYKDSAAASTPITVVEHGTFEPNTFCPIVQPVPESTMQMLSFICWKSLLSFPR